MSIWDTISLIRLDFERYNCGRWDIFYLVAKIFHNPGMLFSLYYRFQSYLAHHLNPVFRFIGRIHYPIYFFVTYYLLSYHIEPSVKIGPGLFLHNRDIVITDSTTIGSGVSVMGQTTLGTSFEEGIHRIIIGDNVKIGAGAKIICKGTLQVADNVKIGANAVVTKNLTTIGGTYVGIPARLIPNT